MTSPRSGERDVGCSGPARPGAALSPLQSPPLYSVLRRSRLQPDWLSAPGAARRLDGARACQPVWPGAACEGQGSHCGWGGPASRRRRAGTRAPLARPARPPHAGTSTWDVAVTSFPCVVEAPSSRAARAVLPKPQ